MSQLRISHLLALLVFALLASNWAKASTEDSTKPHWEDFAKQQASADSESIVANRRVPKRGRIQVVGPMLGFNERRDFYNTLLLSGAGRYHFSENHSWEFARITMNFASESSIAQEIRNQTDFRPDSQTSKLQLSSSYVFTPIYGKYAWGSRKTVYFDVFFLGGAGLRFASNSTQIFGEGGLGMNHFPTGGGFALVPEIRMRLYPEQRSRGTTFVVESMMQLGVAWLF